MVSWKTTPNERKLLLEIHQFFTKNHDYGRKGKSGWLAATQTNDATTSHPLVSEFTHTDRPNRTSSHHEASAKPWEKPESLSGQPQLAMEKNHRTWSIWPFDPLILKRFGEITPVKSNIDTQKWRHVWKEIHLKTPAFWVSMLDFGGVSLFPSRGIPVSSQRHSFRWYCDQW